MAALSAVRSPALAATWNLTTDAKFESLLWPQSYGSGTNDQLQRLELTPTLTAKFTEALRFYAQPTLMWTPQSKSREERVFLEAGEFYFRYRGESFDVQMGNQILNWGVTDGYNPLDVVNARQYYDPTRPVKLAALGVSFSHSSETSEQEFIYIPKNRETLLPGPQSRWLPREVYLPETPGDPLVLLLPETVRYHYESRQSLDRALDHNVGLRLQWHLGFVDLGLTAFEGVAGVPLIQPLITGTVVQISPTIVLQVDPDVTLRTKNYRHRVAGFSWVSSQADFLLKYATKYSQSLGEDPLLPGWTHESVGAIEKNFSFGSEGLLIAVLQYSFINGENLRESNLSVNNIFRRAWMVGGHFTWGDLWTATAFGLYDSHHHSHLLQYTLARRLWDVWTLQGSAEFIAGAPETALGIYRANDNYRLSLKRSF